MCPAEGADAIVKRSTEAKRFSKQHWVAWGNLTLRLRGPVGRDRTTEGTVVGLNGVQGDLKDEDKGVFGGCPEYVRAKSLPLELGTGYLWMLPVPHEPEGTLPIGHEHRSTDELAALQRVQARLELLQRKRPIYYRADHPTLD